MSEQLPVELEPINGNEPVDGVKFDSSSMGKYDDIHWFSKHVTFGFCSELTWKAWRLGKDRPIHNAELWETGDDELVGPLAHRFDEKYQALLNQERLLLSAGSNPGWALTPTMIYVRALLACSWRYILAAAACMLVKATMESALPLLVREVIRAVEKDSFEGIYFALGVTVAGVIAQYFMQQHLRFSEFTMNRLRAVSNFVIYRKALRLRSTSSVSPSEVSTLCASDTQRFVDLAPHAHLIWSSPLQVIAGAIISVEFLGYVGLVGVGAMSLLYPVTFALGRLQTHIRGKLSPVTDKRIRLISELVQGISVVKMYGWEGYLKGRVDDVRKLELGYLWKELLIWAVMVNNLIGYPLIVTAITFLVFIHVDGSLTSSNAFASLTLLTLLKFPMMYFGNAVVFTAQVASACGRIGEFLHSDLEVKSEGDASTPSSESVVVQMKNVTALWQKDADAFTLRDISLKVSRGEVSMVVGTVGSGKTMLCHTLVGESYVQSGSLLMKSSTVAYASQEPFLISGTIRENILFSSPFNQERYLKVLECCALWPDLEQYQDGEMTVVGERGVTLSGGQKARISLARAAYAEEPSLVVLDDPFSALDSGTGKFVAESLLSRNGGFLRDRAVVLVTHARQLISKYGDACLHLHGGNGKWLDHISESPEALAAIGSGVDTDDSDAELEMKETIVNTHFKANTDQMMRILPEHSTIQLVRSENVEGIINIKTYGKYFGAGGGIYYLGGVLTSLCIERFSFTSCDFWLAQWTNAAGVGKPDTYLSNRFDFPSSSDFDGSYFYWKVYIVMVGIMTLLGLTRLLVFATGGVTANRRLFAEAFSAVLQCPMSYFDTTPTGRIVNRFSHDTDRVSFPLIAQLNSLIATMGWFTTGLIVTSIIMPYNMIFIVPASIVAFSLLAFYRSANAHLQRLDACARSDLQSHLHESLNGGIIVRSYGKEVAFCDRCRDLVNGNTRSMFAFVLCQRWVAIRAEILGSLMGGFVCIMVWVFRKELSGGLAGMAINWGLNMARTMTFLVTEGMQAEAKLVSVDRLREFVTDLPTEASQDAGLDGNASLLMVKGSSKPTWPTMGSIDFQDVVMRYRSTLPPTLKGCSFSVKSGLRVGVCGRTGSGKSSLIQCLYRLREIEGGSVLIDGSDIASLGLSAVRGSRMCIIPQDPVLFSGTIRENVDPFGDYSDERLKEALTAVTLWDRLSSQEGLLALVEDRGRNFSVGQKQLICIARAMLRNPSILVMDEATANVDHDTDMIIQEVVRQWFKEATVFEVAHRLHTIIDADVIIVMGGGVVLESASPKELLSNSGSNFSALVDATGPVVSAELRSIAMSS